MPSLVICAALCCHEDVGVGRHQQMGILFVYLFGVFLFISPVFSFRVVSQLFLSF